MTKPGEFRITHTDGRARAGWLATAHGVIETPMFMPVGTQASVKSVSPDELKAAGAQIILSNTYHLRLRPGDELIRDLGGLHKFMAWDKPILTDSGGYQVFSLQAIRKLTEAGVEFRSHLNGSRQFFSPEIVVDIQRNLGSDIMMVLDECVGWGADRDYTAKSLELTARWAARARDAYPQGAGDQLLFGIVQGGFLEDLRELSARQITAIDFDGFAIGGLSVGEPREVYARLAAHTAALLPEARPRYIMGVGAPQDILTAVAAGVDMFDCVLPTRNARNGTLFTSHGKINIKRAEYKRDEGPLDEACDCPACTGYSRAYLRHLYIARELLSYRLNSLHNLHFFLNLAKSARQAVMDGRFREFKEEMEAVYPQEWSRA
ncbi:MAG: queuine tRNA-ribosyltransferase [Desulfovibrionales bacterium]|nr:queuine tRNA-ribosyltransferase [Desulfovibrionales bacterium]